MENNSFALGSALAPIFENYRAGLEEKIKNGSVHTEEISTLIQLGLVVQDGFKFEREQEKQPEPKNWGNASGCADNSPVMSGTIDLGAKEHVKATGRPVGDGVCMDEKRDGKSIMKLVQEIHSILNKNSVVDNLPDENDWYNAKIQLPVEGVLVLLYFPSHKVHTIGFYDFKHRNWVSKGAGVAYPSYWKYMDVPKHEMK